MCLGLDLHGAVLCAYFYLNERQGSKWETELSSERHIQYQGLDVRSCGSHVVEVTEVAAL